MRDATNISISQVVQNSISIHASHAGCDFYVPNRLTWEHISIHASHAGCDGKTGEELSKYAHFNPRIPCGMRQSLQVSFSMLLIFQSTHPMRDATATTASGATASGISIHASHAGCDIINISLLHCHNIFQSTHPMRDAT